jgi:hypothetical protein
MKKLFAFLLSVFILCTISCEIGLGPAVDIAAPTSGISYPPKNAIVRDTFVAAGECNDDMAVVAVEVTLYDTDNNITYGPFDAQLSEDAKSWSVTLNKKDPSKVQNIFDSYKQWEFPDGNYVISAVAYDKTKKVSPEATSPISIDNTAPVLIVSKPLSVGSDPDTTEYGRSVMLAGDIAEEHETSKIILYYKNYEASTLSEEMKSIELNDFGSMSSSNPLVIAKYYNSNVAMNEEKTNWRNTYINLYGTVDESNKNNNHDKSYYCAFMLEDNARLYIDPTDSGSGTGNQTSEYYILSEEVTDLFGNAYSLDVAKLMQILNGKSSYTETQISEIAAVLGHNGNSASSTTIDVSKSSKFNLNPNNSPMWAIDGYDVADTSEATVEAANEYTAGNILTLSLKAGRDNIYIKPNSVTATLYHLTKTGNTYVRDAEGKTLISVGEWTDPAADSATTQISLDIQEHELKNANYYEIEVIGEDRNKVALEPENGQYIFKLSSNGAAPIIEFTGSLNRKWFAGTDIEDSFEITGIITSSTEILKDDVSITNFLVKNNSAGTSPTVDWKKESQPFGASDISTQYPFTLTVTPNSGKLVPSAAAKYTYTITVNVTDIAGTSSAKTLTFYVDNKNPSVDVSGISPTDSNKNGIITVRGTASDNESGLKSLSYHVEKSSDNSVLISETTINTSNSWEFPVDTTRLTATGSGDFDIVITAKDTVGNSYPKTQTIHVDQETDRPTLTLANATYEKSNGDAFEVSDIEKGHNLFNTSSNKSIIGTVTDDDGVEDVKAYYKLYSSTGDYTPLNVTLTKNGKVASFSCDIPNNIAEDVYLIKIVATDKLGETTCNKLEKTFPIAINNNPPTFISTQPESGESNYFKGTLPVSGKIRDLSGKVTITAKHQYKDSSDSQFKDFENNAANKPTSLTLSPITSAALKTTAGADWSDTITLPAVTGTYRVIYTAENAYKQTEIKTIVYSVDETVPVVQPASISGWQSNGNVKLSVTVTDVGSGVDKVGYSFADSNSQSAYTEITKTGVTTWSEDITVEDAEQKTIYIRAQDKNGNADKKSIKVDVDNNAPELVQKWYVKGTNDPAAVLATGTTELFVANEAVTIYGNYSDTISGIDTLSFTLGGKSITPTISYSQKQLTATTAAEAKTQLAANDWGWSTTITNATLVKTWKAVFAASSLEDTLKNASLVVNGKDIASNEISATGIAITKDKTDPGISEIKIQNKKQNQTALTDVYKSTDGDYYVRNQYDGVITITGTTTDDNIDHTEIVIQGNLTAEKFPATGAYTLTDKKWTQSIPSMQTWGSTSATVTITAFDKAGNTDEKTLNIKFDNTAPVIDFTPYNETSYTFRTVPVVKYSGVKIGQGVYSESSYGQLSNITFAFYYQEEGSSFDEIEYQLLTADKTTSADQIIEWQDTPSDGRITGTLKVERGSEDYGYSEYTYYANQNPPLKGLKVTGSIPGFANTQGQNKKNLLLIRATDKCGNKSEVKLLKVLVDQTSPVITVDDYEGTKVNGNILTNGHNEDPITLSGNTGDIDAGLKVLRFSVNGSKIIDTLKPAEAGLPVTTVTAEKRNAANTGFESTTANNDNAVKVSFENSYGTFTYTGYTDSTKTTYCSLNSAAAYAEWSFEIDDDWLQTLDDGDTPYFSIEAEDWAEHNGNGKKASTKVGTLVIDTVAPTVEITSPSNAANAKALYGKQTIKGTTSDTHELEEVKLYIKKPANDSEAAPTTEAGWGTAVKTLSTKNGDNISELLSYKFTDIEIKNYANASNKGKMHVLVVAKDNAGNWSAYNNSKTYSIDLDLDRPVVEISGETLKQGGSNISAANPLTFTKNSFNFNVQDEDGVAEVQYRVLKYDDDLATQDVVKVDWTTVDLNSSGTGKITLPVENNEQIQGTLKIEFSVKDTINTDAFTSTAATDLKKIKLKDSNGNTYNSDPVLYLCVDSKDPEVTFCGITKGTANSPFVAAGDEITSGYSNIVVGGTTKFVKVRFSATDDGTGIKANSQKVEVSLNGTAITGSPFTATAQGGDYVVIFPCSTGDGSYTIKVSATDNANRNNSEQKTITVDNTLPTIDITAPSETTYQSGATTATVELDEVATLYYAITPIEVSPSTYTESTAFTYTYENNTGSPVSLGTGLHNKCGYVQASETKMKLFYIYFDGEESSSSTVINSSLLNDKIIDMGITTEADITKPENPFDKIVKLYLYAKAVDPAGNEKETHSTIWLDPLGERPTAAIGYPAQDGVTLGGKITLMGTATGKYPIDKVYVAIGTIPQSGNISYGAEQEATVNGSSWNLMINKNGELDPANANEMNNISIRVRAVDSLGRSSGYEVRTISIDKDTPVIDQTLKLVQWETGYNGSKYDSSTNTKGGVTVTIQDGEPVLSFTANSYKAIRNYSDRMSLTGNWYLVGKVSDGSGLKEVKVNGTPVINAVKGTYSNAATGTYILNTETKKNEANIEAYNYYFCIPIGKTDEDFVGEDIVEFEAFENTADGKSIPKTFTVRVDNQAPKVIAETDPNYKITKDMVNENGFYSFSSVATENKVNSIEQTGVERIAFFYTREIYGDDSLYDIMIKNDATGNKIAKSAVSQGPEHLWWKEKTGVAISGAAVTLSAKDVNIHVGGLAKVNGSIYKVSTISADGKTITLDDRPGDATGAKVYFAIANVIDNTISEDQGKTKITDDDYGWGYYKDTDGTAYDDGDNMIEALKVGKTNLGSSFTWSASINSRNLDDGPVDLHYVVFDKAGNFTEEKIVQCTVKNNAPRIAGLRVGTDLNGDGNVSEADGEFITTYHVDIDKITTLYGKDDDIVYSAKNDRTGSLITIKGKTEIQPEILGGNGNLNYTYTVAEYDSGTEWQNPYFGPTTSAVLGVGTKSDDTAYAKLGDKLATITIPVSRIVYNNSIHDGDKQKFTFAITDSTPKRKAEGDTQITYDPQQVDFSVIMKVDLRDSDSAENYIMPFYWNSLTSNSVYSQKVPATVADLKGHIELPVDLVNSEDFTTGVLPQVSGTIKLEGIAHDNAIINKISATIDGNSYNIATRNTASEGYLQPINKTLADDGFVVSIQKATYAECVTAGYIDTVPNGKEETDLVEYTTQDYGHIVHWVITLDTEQLLAQTNPVKKNFEITVSAQDLGTPSADSVTEDDSSVSHDSNAASTPESYKMDVVPYIQGIKTYLSTKSRKDDTSEYDRTALGHYPVSSTEQIYIYGFNIAGGKLYDKDGTSVSYTLATTSDTVAKVYIEKGFRVYKTEALTSFASGKVSVKFGTGNNIIESLNNKNYNGSSGSYTGAEPNAAGAQATYTSYNNYFYNHKPNQVNNYLLTDDVELDIWEFNKEAAKPNPSGRVDEPIMKINPSSGIIGFAFLSGPMQYAMPLNNNNSYYGKIAGHQDGDYHAGNGFAYDANGNAYAIECGGNEGSTYYVHLQPNNGTTPANEDAIPKTAIDKSQDGDNNYLRYKLKGASFAATVHGTDKNYYLVYYNSYRERIHFRGVTGKRQNNGNYKWTGHTGNDNGANNTTNSQVIASTNVATLGRAGKYISIDVKTGSQSTNDIVVIVWYDEVAKSLRYAYNDTPLAGTTGENSTNWKNSKVIFTAAGEYCQVKLDGNGGVHIAARTQKGSLKYAYMTGYDATTVYTSDVDTYGNVGSHMTLDVGLDSSNNPVPVISYIGTGLPKIATLKTNTSLTATIDGATNNKFTGNWEISYIPSDSNIVDLDYKERSIEADSRINVGLWKTQAGNIKNSIAPNGTTRKNEAADDGSTGTCWGNGTANPVVAYQTQFDDANERIETAQMK